MGSNIVSISIYVNNQRVKLTPDAGGKFLIPNDSRGAFSPALVRVTAVELINHVKIKFMDPVLALDDGTKLRVFQGGDPSGLLITAISLLEKHDEKYKKNTSITLRRKSLAKSLGASGNSSYPDPTDDFGFDYPWDEPD